MSAVRPLRISLIAGVQRLRGDAGLGEDLRRLGVLLDGQREQQPLDGDEASPAFLAIFSAVSKTLAVGCGEVELAGAAADTLGSAASACSVAASASRGVAAGAVDQTGGQPLGVVEQHLEEMLGGELLVALRQRQVCADWMKPRARSVYFSKFMSALLTRAAAPYGAGGPFEIIDKLFGSSGRKGSAFERSAP